QRRTWLLSTGFPALESRARYRRAVWRLRAVQRVLRAGGCLGRPRDQMRGWTARYQPPLLSLPDLSPAYHLPHSPGVLSNFDRPGYLAAVRRAIEYVHAGDCFQVNLAQRLLHPATLPPLELYRRLRERNPA